MLDLTMFMLDLSSKSRVGLVLTAFCLWNLNEKVFKRKITEERNVQRETNRAAIHNEKKNKKV